MAAPVVMHFPTRRLDEALGTSRRFAKEIAATQRRGFRPDEIARMKDRGTWGVPPLSKGENLSKEGRKQQEINQAIAMHAAAMALGAV